MKDHAKIKIKASCPIYLRFNKLNMHWHGNAQFTKFKVLTLPTVMFSFELYKQKQFNYGQVYVAMGRIKSLEQLHIIGEIDPKHIRADPRVHKEYKRLRSRDLQIS